MSEPHNLIRVTRDGTFHCDDCWQRWIDYLTDVGSVEPVSFGFIKDPPAKTSRLRLLWGGVAHWARALYYIAQYYALKAVGK